MKEALAQPPVQPPIVGHLKWHPWELPRLFSRDVPLRIVRRVFLSGSRIYSRVGFRLVKEAEA